MSDFKYSEICYGYTDRGNCFEVGSLLDLTSDKYQGTDVYSSAFLHCKDFVDYKDPLGSRRGYNGPVLAEFMHWDFDDSDNIMGAYHESKMLIGRLTNKYDVPFDQIRFYFSGGKGFHVYLISPELMLFGAKVETADVVKFAALNIADGLSTIDSSVYDKTRIFRVPNTKHSKTGFYKVPLMPYKNHTFEEITGIAKKPLVVKFADHKSFELNKKIQTVLKSSYKKGALYSGKSKSKKSRGELIDGFVNGFPEGQRNEGLFSIAGMLHKRGVDQSFTYEIINLINESKCMNLPQHEIEAISKSVQKYTVENIQPENSQIMTMAEAAKKWEQQYKTMRSVNFGFPLMNNTLSCFSPGEVLYIAGRAGTGKTTLGMYVGNNLANNASEKALMVSLEMQASRVFFRAATISACEENDSGMDNKDIAKALFEKRQMEKVAAKWRNFLIVDKDSLDLTQIEEYYLMAKETYLNVPFLMIDYLGYISDRKSGSQYEKVTRTAKAIKGLAKRQNIRIIMLCQTNRDSEDGTQPVKLHHMRDSGAIEESADYVVGIYKSRNDKSRLHAEVLKNRNDVDGDKWDFIKTGLSFKDEKYLPEPKRTEDEDF